MPLSISATTISIRTSIRSCRITGSGRRKGTSSYGYTRGPSAFDIAAIQRLYGARAHNASNNAYVLPGTDGPGTYWTCLWDTNGIDAIVYGGRGHATIDLRAATIDNSPTGGGTLSYVTDATTGKPIHGGFTIARNVIIENAAGGSGNDTITGNQVGNTFTGRAGNDVLHGLTGNDLLLGDAGRDELNGGDGIDTVSYASASKGVVADLLVPAGNTGDATGDRYILIEHLTGSSFDDTLRGDNAVNVIRGGAGADALEGRLGLDQLLGGPGNDTYLLNDYAGDSSFASYDLIAEAPGEGTDWVRVGPQPDPGFSAEGFTTKYSLGANIENGLLYGDRVFDLTGNALNNALFGNVAANVLLGLEGNDFLHTGPGADVLDGGAGYDAHRVP